MAKQKRKVSFKDLSPTNKHFDRISSKLLPWFISASVFYYIAGALLLLVPGLSVVGTTIVTLSIISIFMTSIVMSGLKLGVLLTRNRSDTTYTEKKALLENTLDRIQAKKPYSQFVIEIEHQLTGKQLVKILKKIQEEAKYSAETLTEARNELVPHVAKVEEKQCKFVETLVNILCIIMPPFAAIRLEILENAAPRYFMSIDTEHSAKIKEIESTYSDIKKKLSPTLHFKLTAKQATAELTEQLTAAKAFTPQSKQPIAAFSSNDKEASTNLSPTNSPRTAKKPKNPLFNGHGEMHPVVARTLGKNAQPQIKFWCATAAVKRFNERAEFVKHYQQHMAPSISPASPSAATSA